MDADTKETKKRQLQMEVRKRKKRRRELAVEEMRYRAWSGSGTSGLEMGFQGHPLHVSDAKNQENPIAIQTVCNTIKRT